MVNDDAGPDNACSFNDGFQLARAGTVASSSAPLVPCTAAPSVSLQNYPFVGSIPPFVFDDSTPLARGIFFSTTAAIFSKPTRKLVPVDWL